MVQFGKKLLESRFEPWAEHYLDYQGLKRCLKEQKKSKHKWLQQDSIINPPPPPPLYYGSDNVEVESQQPIINGDGPPEHLIITPPTVTESPFGSPQASRGSVSEQSQPLQPYNNIARDFETFLEDEVEKIGLFFLQVQGQLATDLAELRKKQTALVQKELFLHSQEAATMDDAEHRRSALLRSSSVVSTSTEEGRGHFSGGLQDFYTHYHNLAVLLLHLIHFVESNVTGIRKILKKHDKVTHKHLTYAFISMPRAKHRELKHLWSDMLLRQYDGITALNMTLAVALTELRNLEYRQHHQRLAGHQHDNGSHATPAAVHHHHHHHKPPTISQKSRHHPTKSMPNIALTPEDLAVAAAVSDTLVSLPISPTTQSRMTPQPVSSKKLYGGSPPTLAGKVSEMNNGGTSSSHHELDAILLKVEAARRRLNISSNTFQNLLAAQIIMLEPTGSEDLGDDDDEEEMLLMGKDEKWLSHFLNLTSTFLYMTNYYVVAPTSGHYAKMLGGDEALAGIIIGMTPIAALVSTILYSWWTSHSYKSALLFACTCSILGNIFYAIALPCRSLTLVMVGRLLNGFGSARSINRRYIADTFPPRQRTAQSANFVSAGALGMAAGPAIASLLHIGSPVNDFRGGTVHKHIEEIIMEDNAEPMTIISDDDTILFNNENLWWTPENAPGWFMLVAWSIFWVLLWIHFEDPTKHTAAQTKLISKGVEMTKETGENQALLGSQQQGSNGTKGGEEFDSDNNEDHQELPLWRNIPVMTTFVVYFVLKLILECLLSSTATLTSFYFDWDSSVSGIYLAILGLLMLPANLGVAILARNHDDRELIVGCQVAMLLGCCGVIQYRAKDDYTAIQYVLFSVVIFLSTNALEGPNMSLLSKTIPKSWSRGIFNVGLLATEAGTLGRAVGDLLLTAWGYKGLGTVLNACFRTMSICSGLSLAVTLYFFEHLEPYEKDY